LCGLLLFEGDSPNAATLNKAPLGASAEGDRAEANIDVQHADYVSLFIRSLSCVVCIAFSSFSHSLFRLFFDTFTSSALDVFFLHIALLFCFCFIISNSVHRDPRRFESPIERAFVSATTAAAPTRCERRRRLRQERNHQTLANDVNRITGCQHLSCGSLFFL